MSQQTVGFIDYVAQGGDVYKRQVMIHGVAGLLYDYYTLADLKKLQKDFDASERAIAEIYHCLLYTSRCV